MRRRRLLVTCAVTAAAGCLGDGGTGTPTESATPTGSATPTESATPTQASGLGTIEYTVVNEDDEPHRIEVAVENAEGRVVQETFEPSLSPGASVSSGDAGLPPETSPYTLTFRTESTSATYVWEARECHRIDLRVTVTADGGLAIERTLCQN